MKRTRNRTIQTRASVKAAREHGAETRFTNTQTMASTMEVSEEPSRDAEYQNSQIDVRREIPRGNVDTRRIVQ